MRQEGFVPGGSLQLSLFDGAEQQHRVVPAHFPQIAIQPAEECDRIVAPAPAQVVGNLAQVLDRWRQRGYDSERMYGFHPSQISSRQVAEFNRKRHQAEFCAVPEGKLSDQFHEMRSIFPFLRSPSICFRLRPPFLPRALIVPIVPVEGNTRERYATTP